MDRSRNPHTKKSLTHKLSSSIDMPKGIASSHSQGKSVFQLKPLKKKKTITLKYKEGIMVDMEFESEQVGRARIHMTNWLIEEGKKLLEAEATRLGKAIDVKSILGFRTANQDLSVDYWLSLPNKSIDILEENVILIPYFKIDAPKNSFSLNDFEVIKEIGKGAFATAYLARFKETGAFCCLKRMKKSSKGNLEFDKIFNREIDALSQLSNSFIVKYIESFQTSNSTYLALDFIPGGDLKSHLKTLTAFSEEDAKFYMAEILIAFEYLHEQGFIYRDIKPENFLIDAYGHIKLIDFGLAKKIKSADALNHSYCGTLDYMTPEMTQKKVYNASVDYYGLGALLYEIVVGAPPFARYIEEKDLTHAIVNIKPIIPYKFSKNLRDLLLKLLEKDPLNRLGAKGGIKEIMSHAWFADVKFKSIREKKLSPPIKVEFNKLNLGSLHMKMSLNSVEKIDSPSLNLDDSIDCELACDGQYQRYSAAATLVNVDTLVMSQLEICTNGCRSSEKTEGFSDRHQQLALEEAKRELFKRSARVDSESKIEEDSPLLSPSKKGVHNYVSDLQVNLNDMRKKTKTQEEVYTPKRVVFSRSYSAARFST